MHFIRQLQIFVAVVEMGNFSRAAEVLHMARPGVTKAIGDLEKTLGTRLLQRTTRRTNLSNEGEILYSKAVELLNNIEATQNLFGGSKEKPRGKLRIDIPTALAKSLILPELPNFCRQYPDIDVILGVNDQPIDLITNSIDCVLRIGSLPISSMIGRQIASIPMVICASPEYLKKRGIPSSIEELHNHAIINYYSGQKHTSFAWYFSKESKVEEIVFTSSIMANNAETMVACALNNMGIIQVPGILVHDELKEEKLLQVLHNLSNVDFPLSIMYPNRQYLAPKIRVFIDWIINTIESKKGLWIY